jgi:diacylglycerol diphosphate phosphatase / phosphatidate phosphatase
LNWILVSSAAANSTIHETATEMPPPPHCRRPPVWEPRVRTWGPTESKVSRLHPLNLALLAIIDVALNLVEPFHRFVGEDMMTSLRYPMKDNTVPVWAVPVYY